MLRRRQCNQIIANILICMLMLISVRVFLFMADGLTHADVPVWSAPANAVFKVAFYLAHEKPTVIATAFFGAIGAFMIGLVGIICFHGEKWKGFWLVGLSILYLFPLISRFFDWDWFPCDDVSDKPICGLDWDAVIAVISWGVVSPVLVALGGFFGSTLCGSRRNSSIHFWRLWKADDSVDKN